MRNILILTGCGLMAFSLAILLSYLIRAFRAFDDLVQFEHEYALTQWKIDGQPLFVLLISAFAQ
jgi:hypothetical protein